MKIQAALGALAFAMTGPQNAALAQTWPSKPLHIMIASAAGATTDTVSRGLVDILSKQIGQPVIIDNRVGADGIIGTVACAKAPPDGYSLCGTASNVMIWNMVLRPDLPYNTLRDFVPVVHSGFFDSTLVAHISRPYNSVQQLIDYAKANPEKVNWGHFGTNSTGYMYMDWLRKSKGAPFYPVPYKTQPQNILALVTNESDVSLTSFNNSGPHIKAGKLKVLAITSDKRHADMPNVPTFEELGIKLPLRTWQGYHYPSGTPREIVLRMNTELRRAFDNPIYKTNIVDRVGLLPNPGTPEAFDQYVRAQLKDVAELVRYLGVKPE